MEQTMRKLMTAFVATAAILAAGSVAVAMPITGAGGPPSSYSLVEKIGCWCGPYRCACGHPYGYYGGYHPYGYYGGYRPYAYGYRYRY
jgi:hypothetical protein